MAAISLMLLLANSLVLASTANKPLLQFAECQTSNIRVQVNNDKLQSAPYLMEAIRQIESSQNNNNNNNPSSSDADLQQQQQSANYSTILRHDPTTNQIINLGPLSNESAMIRRQPSSHLDSNLVASVLGAAAAAASSDSSMMISESEPTNSRLASLLGQPVELIAAQESNSFPAEANQLLRNNGLSKAPARATVPVTSSHLKRPFGPLTPDQLLGESNQSSKQANYSLVSPSVVSDESLAPVVRLSDEVADETMIDKRVSYHDESPSSESWRNNNDTSQQPRVVYPKAPNRSYTHSGRARITVGAGNQLASASSSTLALESSRSTDLSPTIYNNRQQDMDISNYTETVVVDNDSPIANEELAQPVETMATFQRQRQTNADAIKTLDPTPASASESTGQQMQIIHHTTATTSQEPNHHQREQAMRVIEIPEKIRVTEPEKNDDPIEIMPSPPEPPTPIRLVVNRTRVGRPDARCPKEGVTTFEHPTACDKYYYCDDGYLIEQTCPNGLMYGTMYRVKDYCVYRWHADCVDKTMPNPISSPGCRWQYGVFSVQGSPKCTPDYYECIAGRFEVKKCSIVGQVYDDRTKGCQYAEKVGCPEEIISDFQCPTDDRTNSFWPFPRYYLDTKTIIHCVNDKPRIMRCPDGERVDLEHLYCIPMAAKEPVVMDRKVRERQKGTMQPQKNVQ